MHSENLFFFTENLIFFFENMINSSGENFTFPNTSSSGGIESPFCVYYTGWEITPFAPGGKLSNSSQWNFFL